jgi:CO/xanthine dehydrogenase FAD-binding subunit
VRTPISSLDVVDARSLGDALARLQDDPGLVPLAGCTDVFVLLNGGQLRARRFLNLWRLDELRGIDVVDGALRLGALTTYTDAMASPLVARHLPMLVEASARIGGVQIHNRGTLGGNVMNASPAGDTLPVFAAGDAVLVLQSTGGARRVPFAEFYTGYRRTASRPGELLVAIEVPPVAGRQWFRKVGTRAAQAISKVVMAAVRADPPRIAVGSVAPTVMRLRETERALAAGASMEEARAALDREIAPIDDFRSTARYRRRVTANLVRQFWEETG